MPSPFRRNGARATAEHAAQLEQEQGKERTGRTRRGIYRNLSAEQTDNHALLTLVMGLLTATAIQGYTDYTIRTVSYARYRVGTTYYTVKQPEKSILSDGTVAIDILIDHTVPGNITINQIQLFDMAGNLFLQKTENVIREDVQEGIFYRVKINFTEQ